MESSYRLFSGMPAALAGWFAPVVPLVSCAFCFIAADFITGVAASRAEARMAGRRWWFESAEAWRTVRKLALVTTGIVMTWMLDRFILDFMELHAAKLFTGFACGVEFWSFLENAATLSDAPFFRWMKRFVHHRIRKEVGDEQ
ncbi:phage holin family protein [uncultured Alistipes sp.]|uniref:phage holin family protein n=1 Tax=uncultured Alistipes sp. TaxID=538949 RepID=UPI00260FA41F|nr:phage holin family protein [uncultured Alistipes sp.]